MIQSQALLESIINALEHHNSKNEHTAHVLYQPAVVLPLHDSFAWDEDEDEDDEDEDDEDYDDEDEDDFDWSDDEDDEDYEDEDEEDEEF